jgi:hypothetical protein
VNELAINLPTYFVDNQYFKVLIVPQAVIAEVLRHLFAVFDRIGIRVEFNADAVSIRNAVFHIEEELLHVEGPYVGGCKPGDESHSSTCEAVSA